MRQILTVKELIALLLDYNMDAYVYVNASGLPIGISLPNVCFGGGKEGETKKGTNEVIFDIQEEMYNYKKVLSMELPKEIQIGGQVLTTQICEELGGKLGKCCCYNGYIKIATNVDGSVQTESSMFNTYIHECVHAILDTMGRSDLSQDETFVSSFAGFATEGIVSILKQKS